ncbi:MAG: PQQ-binding-like beta-propeller repeat protein [Verrucomicrobiota bacterium]
MIARSIHAASVYVTCGVLCGCGGGSESANEESEAEVTVVEEEVLVPETNWLLFRGDSAMQGVSEEVLQLPLELAWSFETERAIVATAVIDEGRVYFGSTNGVFYCLDLESGDELWSENLDYAIEGTAAIAGGKVFVGGQDGIVRGFDCVSGEPAWEGYETDGKITGGINVWEDPNEPGRELLLVGSHDYFLYALDAATGEFVWDYETENFVNGTPTIGNGNAIIGGCDNYLRLISMATGDQIAEADIAAYIANTLAVRDGIAYLAHYGGLVEAYDLETLENVWQFEVPRVEFQASPAVTATHVYVAGRDKVVRCLDRVHGEQVWEFSARRGIDSSPLACPNAVYVGSGDARLYALHPETGDELWSNELGSGISASPAVGEGFLVIGGEDGVLYGFRSGQGGAE